jgi:GH24 family phage-related lysozyme (muramidase)
MASQILLSDAGVKFMTQPSFDSFQALPYKDSGGLWTIGFGSRITATQAIQYKNGITEEFAWRLFKDHNVGLTSQLQQCPLAGLQQWQYDAIISLCYNMGFDQFINSTVYKRLITRSYDLTPWLAYVHDAKGNLDQGLVRRRQMELRLFIWGLY